MEWIRARKTPLPAGGGNYLICADRSFLMAIIAAFVTRTTQRLSNAQEIGSPPSGNRREFEKHDQRAAPATPELLPHLAGTGDTPGCELQNRPAWRDQAAR